MRYPEGFNSTGMVLLLRRALYGLRQSPKLWLDKLGGILKDLGLKQVSDELCVFTNDWLIIFFYVDDIGAAYHRCNTERFRSFTDKLASRLKLRDLGEMTWFLGIRLVRDRQQRKLWLCQDTYIEKIANRYHLNGTHKSFETPLPTDDLTAYRSADATDAEITLYKGKVGSITYPANITRPDVTRAASHLAEFSHCPHAKHMIAADRVIGYLWRTKHYALEYGPVDYLEEQRFRIFSDAAFADDVETRRSSNGYVFKLYSGAVDWQSSRQRSVTTSTTEAELHALSMTARMALWWKRLFEDLHFDTKQLLTIGCDNVQTIRLLTAETPRLVTKLRHVDIHHHWVREKIDQHELQLAYVPTDDMVADGMTKSLGRQKHEKFVTMLGLRPIELPVTPVQMEEFPE